MMYTLQILSVNADNYLLFKCNDMDAKQSYLGLFTIKHAYTSVFSELVSL
jgi:hypothetical protein